MCKGIDGVMRSVQYPPQALCNLPEAHSVPPRGVKNCGWGMLGSRVEGRPTVCGWLTGRPTVFGVRSADRPANPRSFVIKGGPTLWRGTMLPGKGVAWVKGGIFTKGGAYKARCIALAIGLLFKGPG